MTVVPAVRAIIARECVLGGGASGRGVQEVPQDAGKRR